MHRDLMLLSMLLLALLCASAAPASAQPAATSAGAAEAATLSEKLEALRKEHDVPALGAALLRDGEVVELAVTGVTRAGGDAAVSPDDAWHIGSCTKSMTATLAARLVEQGKISWDTTIAEGLPDLAAEMHEGVRSVTLRQLLGHRGGIVGHEANSYAMPMLWQIEQEKDTSMRDRRAKAAARILKAPPAGEAGKEFRYSNYGYVVAGAMLEHAAGAAWEDLMRREVFEPLGITTAGFGPPPRIAGHVKREEKWTAQDRDNPLVMSPAGTVHLSLADWAKFAAAHLGQVEGYLKPETLAVLHEPLEGEGAIYALGLGAGKNEEGKAVELYHSGSNTMWYAVIVLIPERGEARLAVANCMSEAAVDAAIGALGK